MDPLAPLAFLGRNDCTAQSIVKALDNFLKAVQKMRDVVMVPNKLKDMNAVICTSEVWPSDQASQSLTTMKFSHAGAGRGAEVRVDLYSFYRTLHAIRNELMCGVPPRDHQPLPAQNPTPQVHLATNLMCAIGRHQGGALALAVKDAPDSAYSSLESQYSTTNSSDDEGVEVDVSSSESPLVQEGQQHANELAAVFREHLTGLFAVLRQLTGAADYLSKRYEDEVDQPSS